MVGRMRGGPVSDGGKVRRIEAAEVPQGECPETSVRGHHGAVSAVIPDGGADAPRLGVIVGELSRPVEEQLPVARLQDFIDARRLAVYRNAEELPVVRMEGDSVRGADPELAGSAAAQGGDVVVREAKRVVRAEILVVVLDGIFVEPAESADPDVSVGIFGEGLYPLVGYAVGDDDVAVCADGSRCSVLPFAGGCQQRTAAARDERARG